MYKFVHRLSWVVAFAMLLHSFYFWGGVAQTPIVGTQVLTQAMRSLDTIGVAFYAQTGGSMVGLAGSQDAIVYAGRHVGHVYPKLAGRTEGSAHVVRKALTGLPKATHYGTPIAFLIAILLFWRREKPIENFKG